MAMQMKYGEHGHEVVVNGKEHAVRKITNEGAPSAFVDLRKLERILEDSRKQGIDLRFEVETEVCALTLVSKRRFEDVELGLRRDLDPPHSASAAEAGQKLFADLGPRAGGDLATSMRGEPLGNDVTVPVRHRDLLGVLREVIPQRLNVFELFVGRELVKARRRKCRLRHAASIPSSCWRQAATGGSTDGNPSADCSSS